jgi:all-trans-retinol 13,14-reductase
VSRTRHAVVVGGGCSGLVSALLLAKAGVRVTLLERADEVAPLLRRRTLEGFEFAHGFQYLGGYLPGGGLDELFARLGIRGEVPLRPVGAHGLDEFHGILPEPVVLPVGADAARAALAKAFPSSTAALEAYFRLLDEVLPGLRFTDLEALLARPGLTSVSVQQFMREQGAQPALVDLMGAHSDFLMGVGAKQCSLLLHLLGVGAYYVAAHWIEGGGGALVDALAQRVRAEGVEVRTGCEVVALDCAPPRRFKAVRARGRDGAQLTLEAEAAIVTIHPKRLQALLPSGLSSLPYLKRLAGFADTGASCCFHLAVEAQVARRFTRLRHYFGRDASGAPALRLSLLPDFGEREGPGGERRLAVGFPLWQVDCGPGCPGRGGRRCAAPDEPAGGVGDLDRFRPALEEHIRELLPELVGKYRVLGGFSPCDLERLNGTWKGSLYGLKCSYDRSGLVFIGPVNGVYLAGQSIVAPGVLGAAISAQLAVTALLERGGP